jgi:hypothetical protein
MKTILLAAGAIAVTMIGGSALAAPRHHKASSAAYAEPKQPIPYAQLGAYMKASPTQRASNDWWSGQTMASSASTGSTANAAATAPAASTPDTTPSASASPGPTTPPGSDASSSSTTATPPSGEVNPPASSTPPSATPPK